MVTMWHQQVFALDAKYNAQRVNKLPTLGMLYIRRRNQLLKEKFSKNSKIRENYFRLRARLLFLRYGENLEQNSFNNYTTEEEKSEIKTKLYNIQRKSIAESFAFDGVHHVFDQHNAPVMMLKFANNDRSKLCCASLDGSLSICDVISIPPKVIVLLEGHKKGVTSLDWSISNDLIVSSSLDATIRLWNVLDIENNPTCLRVVNDQQQAEVLCCGFIPINNNLVVAGNSQGLVQILNISTGIYTRNGSCKIGGKILSLTCEGSGGSVIWVGNDRGIIMSFQLEPGSGRLTKLKRVQEIGGMISSLSWRSWLSKDAPWPALLVSSACNIVLLYHIIDNQGSLSLWTKYPIKHKQYFVKSTFCPQMETCLIATGSEDGTIHLLDSARKGKAAKINRLQGHATPTIALSFNFDESLLASADYQGLIILWRNRQRHI
ncbi:WD repeat-containing protein 13 [Apis mellifera caucasica]|uniref:WD repeat-containing protein 13 n=1 Tax=Apis mellifera TaxID=7460 RepID=A0A7M7R6F6_APIME|nr:WD repeat-containing protein 13 [Apis mellifera]KAG6800536.1 WD repeat-containing protein 13 [Apis mellifera caucasica]KAG9434478.1 WD repeat-containing protein 13 [Apis mellifera carnica]|eukprot:XP_396208.4 WD repeat-containing protein 13 [Apis mellifera]